MSDEAYVRVPVSAMRWLMGEAENFAPDPGQNGAYWWRSEFRRRIKIGQSVAVPPAMQRASAEAQFNVVGDELAKINKRLDLMEQVREERWHYFQGMMQGVVALEDRQGNIEHFMTLATDNMKEMAERQQLIMQKLAGGENEYGAEFTQLKCLLDLTNKRLRALELDGSRRARKRQPKPVRPASKRKSTRKL